MIVDKLMLQYFRNYKKKQFSFSPSVTLILGPNAAGKTNILEAIYLVSTGRSFRAEKDRDMIFWGEDIGRIQSTSIPSSYAGIQHRISEEVGLEIVLTNGTVQGEKARVKKFLVNGVPRRSVDFVGNLRVVHFSPEDLELVIDSPSVRRNYLNSVLSQIDREYRRNLMSYEKGLRQRNAILERIKEGLSERSQLFFWDQLLIKAGSYITASRELFINTINRYVIDDLSYQLVYDPSFISESRLEQYKFEEVAAKTTLVGPQRDDFSFVKRKKTEKQPLIFRNDTMDVGRFGSRGEQRLAVLWLKLAELMYIEEKARDRPVLLLDDVFSELDEQSRRLVLSIIYKQQTIITSAEESIKQLFRDHRDIAVIQLPL